MMDPRLTRDLIGRLPECVPDPGPIARAQVSEDHYPAIARKLFEAHRKTGVTRFFAIGSLIWKPRPYFADMEPARIHGWHRAFCLGPDTRYRGNPEAPGLMLSLDRGGSCKGMVIRLKDDIGEAELLDLVQSEPPPPPHPVTAHTATGPVAAWAFTCPRDYAGYVNGLTEAEIADRLSCCVGMRGTMAEYVLNTIEHLDEAGIRDPMLWRMQALIAERLERSD